MLTCQINRPESLVSQSFLPAGRGLCFVLDNGLLSLNHLIMDYFHLNREVPPQLNASTNKMFRIRHPPRVVCDVPLSRDRTRKFGSWTHDRVTQKGVGSSSAVPRRPQSARRGRRSFKRANGKTTKISTTSPPRAKAHDQIPYFAIHAISEAARRERANTSRHLPVYEDTVEIRPKCSGKPWGAKNVMWYFQSAYDHRLHGNFEDAIADYTSALAINQHDIRCLINRGFCFCHLGKFDRGLRDFMEAAQVDPSEPHVLYNLGLGYQKLDRFDESIDALTRAYEALGESHHHKTSSSSGDAAKAFLQRSILRARAFSLRQARRFVESSFDYATLDEDFVTGRQVASSAKSIQSSSFPRFLSFRREGGTEFYSTGPVFVEHNNLFDINDYKGLNLSHLNIEFDTANPDSKTVKHRLNDKISRVLKSLHKPQEERSDDDINVLYALTENIPAFATKLGKESHWNLCRNMLVVDLHDQDILFEQGETGELFYVIVSGEISLHIEQHHRISTERATGVVQEKHVYGDEEKNMPKTVKGEPPLSTSKCPTSPSWECAWKQRMTGIQAGKTASLNNANIKSIKTLTDVPDKTLRYITTLHTGDTFGELALVENAPRRATCVAEGRTILLAVDKESFNRVLRRTQTLQKENLIKFLSSVDILRLMSQEDLGSLSGIVERVHYNCDSVVIPEGSYFQHLRIVKSGKCRVVKGLPLKDNLAKPTISSTHSSAKQTLENKRRRSQRTIDSLELISPRAGASTRFTVAHDAQMGWEHRRQHATEKHIRKAKARKNWDSGRHDAHHPDSKEAAEFISHTSTIDDQQVEEEPIELAVLLPGDTIGAENILGFDSDGGTGSVTRERRNLASASIVAETQVEILVIRKLDLFRRTGFGMRKKMRESVHKSSASDIVADPGEQILKKKKWKKFCSELMAEINCKHLKKSELHGN